MQHRLIWALIAFQSCICFADSPATQPTYSTTRPSADGIGKVYMGREIAFVMGHQGIHWLERPTRELEEQPRKAIELMQLKETDVVADIGAGSGYFSFRMASKVPKGKVLAVDIQQEMLAVVNADAKKKGITNVETILGTIEDPKLPEGSVNSDNAMPIFGRMHSRLSAPPVVTAIRGMLSFGFPSPWVRGSRVCAAVSAVLPQQATLGMAICRRQRPS